MRWIYLAAITLFALAAFIFAIQNFDVVTMSFLSFKLRAPLAVLTIVATSSARQPAAVCLHYYADVMKGSTRGTMGS